MKRAWNWLRELVGPRECVQLAGLVSMSIGAGLYSLPAGFILFGAGLWYLTTLHLVVIAMLRR